MSMASFFRNNSGATVETFAAFAGVLAIVAVTGAHMLDQWVQGQNDPLLATQARANGGPAGWALGLASLVRGDGASGTGVDYTPTGFIGGSGRPIVLDPCTGKTK